MSYKISIDRVVDIFSSLAGSDALTDGRVFCRSASAALSEWLDGSKSLADNDYQICYAAACIANYRYTLNRNADAFDIKAGDITVNDCSQRTAEYASRLMSNALEAISHLLRPKRFAFIKTGE